MTVAKLYANAADTSQRQGNTALALGASSAPSSRDTVDEMPRGASTTAPRIKASTRCATRSVSHDWSAWRGYPRRLLPQPLRSRPLPRRADLWGVAGTACPAAPANSAELRRHDLQERACSRELQRALAP